MLWFVLSLIVKNREVLPIAGIDFLHRGVNMEYVKNVLGYYFRNFLYLIIFAAAPAIFVGLLLKPFGIFEFAFEYHNLTLNNYGDFFVNIFLGSWWSVLYLFLGLVLIIVTTSLMLGFIESHFRVGKPSLVNSFSLNNNVLGVAKSTFALFLLAFVVEILLSLLMFFVHFLSGGNAVAIIFNYIVALGVCVLLGRGFNLFGYATIDMLINNAPLLVGLSNASRAVSAKGNKVWLVEVVGFLVCFGIMQIFTAIGLPMVGNIISIILFMPLVCVNSMTLFFERNNLPRKDTLKYYEMR